MTTLPATYSEIALMRMRAVALYRAYAAARVAASAKSA